MLFNLPVCKKRWHCVLIAAVGHFNRKSVLCKSLLEKILSSEDNFGINSDRTYTQILIKTDEALYLVLLLY